MNAARIPTLYALLALSVFTLTRLALAPWAGVDEVLAGDWPVVFAKGLWFDLVVTSALLAPVWLYEAAPPNSWRVSRAFRLGALRPQWYVPD